MLLPARSLTPHVPPFPQLGPSSRRTVHCVQQRQRRTFVGGRSASGAEIARTTRGVVFASASESAVEMEKPLKPSVEEVNECMEALREKQAEWASLSHTIKADMLLEIRAKVLDVLESWGSIVPTVKGLDQNPTSAPGEVVRIAAIVFGMLNRNISVLRHVAKYGKFPTLPLKTLQSGQQVAKVFPLSIADRLDTFGVFGIQAEVWIQPNKPASQGCDVLGNTVGGVAVVLAAGNHSYIGLMDALEQLFHHNRVAVLKYHEVQAPLTPVLEYILSPLRKLGYVWGVEADIQVTQAIIYHPLTTHLHMTGGNSTHDAIVWGPPGAKRQGALESNRPLLKVPITSELGNITPWIIAPGGTWTEAQLKHHAAAVTEALLDNCSCNCLAAKVIILWDGWELADAFVSMLKHEICAAPSLPPYYPGCRERQHAFLKHYPEAELLHSVNPSYTSRLGAIPVAMLQYAGVPNDPGAEPFLTTEPFSPVVTIVRLPANTNDAAGSPSVGFLREAVNFCNTSLWGNLTCTLLVHPEVHKAHEAEVEEAIAQLEYGLVAVNAWSGLGFASETAFWGGFQGNQTLQNPLSGIGSSHNAYMLDHPQKSVLRAPFMCGLHPMPQYKTPLPVALPMAVSPRVLWIIARLFAGYLASGVSGLIRALFWPRSAVSRV